MASKNRHTARPQADVDPVIEQLAELLQRSRMTDSQIADKVSKARHGNMSPSTVTNVRELETRRPSNFTVEWIGWALGFKRQWHPI